METELKGGYTGDYIGKYYRGYSFRSFIGDYIGDYDRHWGY